MVQGRLGAELAETAGERKRMSGVMRAAYQLCRFYWLLTRPVSLGAVGVVLDEKGRVLLVKNSYQRGWLLPGGAVDRGESAREALARELREEVSIECAPESLKLTGVYYHRVHFKHDHQVVYLARHWRALGERRRNFEIEASDFFEPEALPPGTKPGMREKIEDALRGV